MSRGSRMTEHPRVLVEAARVAVEERRGVQRRGFGVGAGCGVSPRERERIARELVEEQDEMGVPAHLRRW